MATPEQLTGTPLATALWEQGLAPTGTTRLEHKDGPSYYLPPPHGVRWRPWQSWDHVAHLIIRFRLEARWCTPGMADHVAQIWVANGQDIEPVWTMQDFVSAICRLSLRVEAASRNAEIYGNASANFAQTESDAIST